MTTAASMRSASVFADLRHASRTGTVTTELTDTPDLVAIAAQRKTLARIDGAAGAVGICVGLLIPRSRDLPHRLGWGWCPNASTEC
jgi:hypothetical protein